jgi:large subunit ribosomal protein L17
MRHNVSGRKFNRTKSHKDAMLANMASSLLEYKKVYTTEAKAKELRPFVEALITKAKHALAREKQNLLPEGQTVDIHNRRLVYRVIRNKGVIEELFDAIAPVVEARNGGYCRITKTGTRRGDAARTAIIELVDWSSPVDGAISNKRRKKTTTKNIVKKSDANIEKVETASIEEKIETPISEEIATTNESIATNEIAEPILETAAETEKTNAVSEASVIETTPVVEEIEKEEKDNSESI